MAVKSSAKRGAVLAKKRGMSAAAQKLANAKAKKAQVGGAKKKAPKKTELVLLRTSAFDLTRYALHSLSPPVFEFINYIQDETENPFEEDEEGKKKNKVKKAPPELKIVPELIHDVESFDSLVIQASKILGNTKSGSKGMELLKCMRRTVARNFRIDNKKLEKALQEEDRDKENDGDDGEELQGKNKKAKKAMAVVVEESEVY